MKATPINVTPEELGMVKDYIILPIMLIYIKKDLETFGQVRTYNELIYINVLHQAEREIDAAHLIIRQRLRKRGIKVFNEQRTKKSLDAEYLCRGYTHKISILWTLVRAESLTLMSRYTGVNIIE